jgi:hypothetical protein
VIYFDADQVRKVEKELPWHLMPGKWRKKKNPGRKSGGGVLIKKGPDCLSHTAY